MDTEKEYVKRLEERSRYVESKDDPKSPEEIVIEYLRAIGKTKIANIFERIINRE